VKKPVLGDAVAQCKIGIRIRISGTPLFQRFEKRLHGFTPNDNE
jgi:hypothetical protein